MQHTVNKTPHVRMSTLFSTSFIAMIIHLIDMLSYGNSLFYSKNNECLDKLLKPGEKEYLQNCGSLCYIYSTIISQICFNLFSRIDNAIMSGVIVESLRFMSYYYGKRISMYVDDLEGYFSNFVILLIISTLCFSCASLIAKKYNVGRIIYCIPRSVINGCFGTIGLIQFPVGWECLVPTGNFDRRKLLLVILGISIALVLFLLEYKYPTIDYIIPVYSLIIIIITYCCFAFLNAKNYRMDFLRKHNFLPRKEKIVFFNYIFQKFRYKTICFQPILYSVHYIFSVTFFNLIYSVVNLPAYQISTKSKIDFSYELGAQGYTNIFTLIPSYFVASYSITFARIGGNKKLYGFVSSFAMIFIAVFGLVIKGFIPTFILSMVPFLLCANFLHMAFIKSIPDATIPEYIVSVLVCVISYISNQFICGILFGFILYFIVYFIVKKRKSHPIDYDQNIFSQTQIIVIDYPFCFINAYKFNYHPLADRIIIDFSSCAFIDWVGTDIIYAFCKIQNAIYILNRPSNLKVNRFKDLKNVLLIDNYQSLLQHFVTRQRIT